MPRAFASATAFCTLVALMAAGCAPSSPYPPGMTQVCDDKGCTVRDPRIGSFVPKDDTGSKQQADADAYRGENLADLRGAAQAGDPVAAYKLGEVYLYGLGGVSRNASLAAQNFEIAAGRGHAWAQFRLAEMLQNGQGGRRDPQRAMELTFSAAKSGQAQAAYNIGLAYFQGKGQPQDNTEAARWFTIAAENGVPQAQYDLGLLYYRGDGVPQQLYEALQWMRRSAQRGYLPAQVAVGRLYMTGLDTMGQDLTEARTWLTLAAGKGNADAKRWLDEVVKAEAIGAEQDRQLRMQEAQTATLWAGAILAAALAPPPVYIYGY